MRSPRRVSTWMCHALCVTLLFVVYSVRPAGGQAQSAQPPASQPQTPPRPQPQVDPDRARALYVSKDPQDQALGYDFQRDIERKAETDKRYADVTRGVVDFSKVTYRSSVGDLDVPAYLFQPLIKRGEKGHAAMVWVHGGVHGNWDVTMWPFVREAVERGYVVICPEYRGSTGFGEAYHKEIDYGGYEVDDVMSAVDYQVDKLQVPLLVHVATNDTDVDFVEDQQMVDALRSRKGSLAETKIYVDPPPGRAGGGHTFSRRVDPQTLQRQDTPEQRDSWARTWAFFEWNLRPYIDKSKPQTAASTAR